LLELHLRHTTTKHLWKGPRAGAETALVLGALRRRGTIDAILQTYSTRKLPLVKPATLACLRIAAFDLLFLDDSPPHAVVHAAVQNAKEFSRHKDTGFLNALLRSVMRGSKRVPGAEATDARRSLPLNGESHLARGSVPRWIAERRLEEWGPERALACLDLQARTPHIFARMAAGREDEVRAALESAGIFFRDGPHARLLELPSSQKIGAVFEAAGSVLSVQDAIASQVAPFLAPEPGWNVLDYCAAPGGKTTHLAELVGPKGRVTACDIDGERLALVAENAERLGLANIACVPLPAELAGGFDAVLVDAPCSNTGVLARRPEARWRVRRKDLHGLSQRQLKILRQASAQVRPGGVVVYSTCSLEDEENLGVVRGFLERGGFELLKAKTVAPDEGAGDGGFMARLRRV
jgi:16S rRNA (cytosine967-C5)-methyltransferase